MIYLRSVKKIKPYIIGVSGGSGSGKTTFLKSIRERFLPSEVCIISQDDFYHPINKQFVDKNGYVNFDLPTSIDLKKLENVLADLIKGKIVQWHEYNFQNKKLKTKDLVFIPAPIIVIEGLFVFYSKKIFSKINLKIFVDAKDNLKVIRRIRRDQIERNLPLEQILYQYEYHVLPAFEQYIQAHKDRVDIIINNNINLHAATDLIDGYIRHRLEKHNK